MDDKIIIICSLVPNGERVLFIEIALHIGNVLVHDSEVKRLHYLDIRWYLFSSRSNGGS
jgi:hypothetical protein